MLEILALWLLISIPASLLIGRFLALSNREDEAHMVVGEQSCNGHGAPSPSLDALDVEDKPEHLVGV